MECNNLDGIYRDNQITVIKGLLNEMDIDLSENIIFILGEGISCKFRLLNYASLKKINLWYFNGLNENFTINILSKLNIKISQFQGQNDMDFIKIIDRELNEGNFVICTVDDEFYKDYTVVNSSKIPSIRVLNFTRIKEIKFSENLVSLYYTNYSNTRTEEKNIEITVDKFILSANSNSIPIAPSRRGYIIRKENDCEVFFDNIDSILRESLVNICNRMLQNSMDDDGSIVGIYAIKRLLEQLEDFNRDIEGYIKDEIIINKLFDMRFKILRKTINSSSINFYRDEFGHALKEIGRIFKNKRLVEISLQFIEQGKRWRNLNRIISIATFRSSNKVEFITRVIKELEEILKFERTLFIGILDALGVSNNYNK